EQRRQEQLRAQQLQRMADLKRQAEQNKLKKKFQAQQQPKGQVRVIRFLGNAQPIGFAKLQKRAVLQNSHIAAKCVLF
ncbi:MAG TPA: hypothetical protein VFP93_02275, partial [Gammaproteobacteria bacterium]|nr:hypothetical protein [Gammaproteobacteria bacterium]